MAGGKWLPAALLAGVCLASLPMAQGVAAPMIDPTPATVIAGQSITLTLSDTVFGVGGVDLLVTYDPSLLTVTSVANGELLSTWEPASFDPIKSVIKIYEKIDGSSDDADGTGTIVSLTFAATLTDPTGITMVTIQPATDPNSADGMNAALSGEYEGDTVQTSINITAAPVTTPVPEPGTLALLLAPMLAAAGFTRRNRC